MTAVKGYVQNHALARPITNGGSQIAVNDAHGGAHKYWRLYITANNGDPNYTAVAQLEMYDAVGGADLCVGGTASESSFYSTVTTGEFAFAENWGLTSEWRTKLGEHIGSWLGYELVAAKEIIGFRFYTYDAAAAWDYAPGVFRLEYSDDGIIWTAKIHGQATVEPNAKQQAFTFYDDAYIGVFAGTATLPLPTVDIVLATKPTMESSLLLWSPQSADGGMSQLEVSGWLDQDYGINLPALTCDGTILLGATNSPLDRLELQPLTMAATLAQGNSLNGAVTLPALTLVAETPVAGAVTLPELQVSGTWETGRVGTANLRLPRLAVQSNADGTLDDDRILNGAITATPLTVSASIISGNVSTSINITLKKLILAAEGVSGTVSTGIITLPLLDVSGTHQPEVIGTADITLPLLQLIATGSNDLSSPITTGLNNQAYALNVRNSALTELTNYSFNSFCKFNGQYLAASDNGIFVMSGDTDNGTNIDATARMHLTDFTELNNEFVKIDTLKRVVEAFVAYRTDGNLILKVMADEDTGYEYLLKTTGWAGAHRNRVKFRKGKKGQYWQTEIRNVAGSDFNLDSLELAVANLKRKLK